MNDNKDTPSVSETKTISPSYWNWKLLCMLGGVVVIIISVVAMDNEHNNNIIEQSNNEFDDSRSCDESMLSTPDYDNLGADCEEEEVQFQQYQHEEQNDVNVAQTISAFPVIPTENEFDNIGSNDHQEDGHIDIDYEAIGEDYILGTLMVRVLQARNLRVSFFQHPNNPLYIWLMN